MRGLFLLFYKQGQPNKKERMMVKKALVSAYLQTKKNTKKSFPVCSRLDRRLRIGGMRLGVGEGNDGSNFYLARRSNQSSRKRIRSDCSIVRA